MDTGATELASRIRRYYLNPSLLSGDRLKPLVSKKDETESHEEECCCSCIRMAGDWREGRSRDQDWNTISGGRPTLPNTTHPLKKTPYR